MKVMRPKMQLSGGFAPVSLDREERFQIVNKNFPLFEK